MADRFSKLARSRIMASVRNVNTRPEMFVRKKLFSSGFRYRLHQGSLPGKPDITLPKFNMAVFVNGCFWHGHKCQRGKRPSSNTVFWNKKLAANILRDKKNIMALKELGWRVVVVWQCLIEDGTEKLLRRLKKLSKEMAGTTH